MVVDSPAGNWLNDTKMLEKKWKSDIKTRKSEKQALQPTLYMIVYISANYALNKQEEQVRIWNFKE